MSIELIVALSLTNATKNDGDECTKNAVLVTLYTIPTFNDLEKKPFKNIEGKGQIAAYQHFLLVSQCFLPFPTKLKFFCHIKFVAWNGFQIMHV